MKSEHLQKLATGLAPVVVDEVTTALAPFDARVKALEDRAPVPGPAGEPGPIGPMGPAGPAGEKGDQGPAGAAGAPGRDGVHGGPGEKGIDGKDGRDGRDGKDGIHGKDGAPGPAGQKGIDGQNGRDGVDGFSLEDFVVEFDGERQFTFGFKRGEMVKTFVFTVPALLYRGVFEDGRTYEKGDVVTWGGHAWIAKESTAGKPGVTSEASRAWQLAVKAGREGREGKAGPTGPQGPRGEKGDAVRFSS